LYRPPPPQRNLSTRIAWRTSPSDDGFVDYQRTDGQATKCRIGRIPVHTAERAATVVNKIIVRPTSFRTRTEATWFLGHLTSANPADFNRRNNTRSEILVGTNKICLLIKHHSRSGPKTDGEEGSTRPNSSRAAGIIHFTQSPVRSNSMERWSMTEDDMADLLDKSQGHTHWL